MKDSVLHSIIFQHGENDFSVWSLDIPEKAKSEIMEILKKYTNDGCSVRGNREDLGIQKIV